MKADAISIICEETGWNRERALSSILEAERAGIPWHVYMVKKVWELNDLAIEQLKADLKQIDSDIKKEMSKKEPFSNSLQKTSNKRISKIRKD